MGVEPEDLIADIKALLDIIDDPSTTSDARPDLFAAIDDYLKALKGAYDDKKT